MTQKTAKKIGEAFAFAKVLQDTFSQNKEVMNELLGDHGSLVLETTKAQQESLISVAQHYTLAEVVLPKSEKTGAKITKMGEMYVGDDWDDVAEVLEWMSFFVGGAIVHWQLISGSAEEMNDEKFQTVAQKGTDYYLGLLEQLRSYSVKIGKQRAQSE